MKSKTKMTEVFGFQVPTETYYLHQGHTWVIVEEADRVRVGLDDFSLKLFGQAEELKLPEVGKVYYQDHIVMALIREGRKASFEAPVDGVIEAINPKITQQPGLISDDPYGEGWLFEMKPINLQRNLNNLLSGQMNVAWTNHEAHRLLNLMDTQVGVTLPDGGTVVNDVYGHYPKLGWRPLVQTFLLKNLTRPSTRRGFEGWDRDQRSL